MVVDNNNDRIGMSNIVRVFPGVRVNGTQFCQDVFAGFLESPGRLTVFPDNNNKYDPNAVAVLHEGKLMGYINRSGAKWMRNFSTDHNVGFKVVGHKMKTDENDNRYLVVDLETYLLQ